MQRLLTTLTLLTATLALAAQDYQGNWAIEGTLGGTVMTTKDGITTNDNQGKIFTLGADYYLTNRLALSSQLYFERTDIFTDISTDTGLKRYNMMGLEAGGKFYFLPRKWIVQAYLGASAAANVLNLSENKGRMTFTTSDYQGSVGTMDYTVKCPLLSVGPKMGVEVRVLSSLSLTFDMAYRIGLGGHSTASAFLTEGPAAGKALKTDDTMNRMAYQVGLKLDFPTRKASDKAINNLIQLLFSIFTPSEYYY